MRLPRGKNKLEKDSTLSPGDISASGGPIEKEEIMAEEENQDSLVV